MSWYFTSDLHLSHQSLMRGFRGDVFLSLEEHNEIIVKNLLALPAGSDLVIAGDLFWRYSSKKVEEFFTQFKKRRINIHIVYGNHDKMSWFKSSAIKSQGHLKEIKVGNHWITISHYPMVVFNKSHYNGWNLYGHIHNRDSTWNKALHMQGGYGLDGKKLNINIELHDFKPWSFEQVEEYMSTRQDNWDLIKKEDEWT